LSNCLREPCFGRRTDFVHWKPFADGTL
jgi:hypothetical protein